MMPPSTVPSGLPSEPMTMTANAVIVTSAPIAGVMLPSMNGANTPATAAKSDADAERDGGHAMHVDAGRNGLVAVVHHRAGQIAEPGAIQIEIDQQHRAAAGNAARHPGRRKGLPEQFHRAGLDRVAGEQTCDRGERAPELVAGDRPLAGAEGDGRHRFDHLRQAEEQDERQHLRILGAQQPRHQQIIERQADDHEHDERDRDRRQSD